MAKTTCSFVALMALAPLYSQELSYTLYNVPLVRRPKTQSQGKVTSTPGKLTPTLKNNSPQKLLRLDSQFSLAVYDSPSKSLDSIHLGLDDSSSALGEEFFIRSSNNVFSNSRDQSQRIRIQTSKAGDFEKAIKIEFLSNISIPLRSNTSVVRDLISFLPGFNSYNHLITINAGSVIEVAP
jgi:hypothetical protein